MANPDTAETPQDCRCTKSGAEMLACACRRERGEAGEHHAEPEAALAKLPADDESRTALDPPAGTPAAETTPA